VLSEKVRQLALGAGAGSCGAILNKISADELGSVLTAELDRRHIPVLATIRQHDEIVSAGLAGRPPDSAAARREAAAAADALLGRDARDS
jgi:CO dehydrogenase nickel-insertion accessory protein CooC1